MAEFKLGRIRFVWKGEWASSTTYYVDDVIRNGGQVYICTAGHTADADFYNDLNDTTPKWQLMSSGQDWKDEWQVATYYKVNDLVKYGGIIYLCNLAHTSAATVALGLENDIAKWDLFSEGFDWKGDWSTSTRYKPNDLVKYGGYTYVCNTGHTSASTSATGLEGDQSKWDSFNEGVEYKGSWTGTTRYKVNDLVKFGGGIWKANNAHTSSGDFATDIANWNQFVEGIQFNDSWSSITQYQPGDIIKYGGNQYIAKTVNTNNIPSTSTANWDLFSKGFDLQGNWSIATSYRPGQVVKDGGNTYLAIIDSPSITATATATASSSNRVTVSTTTGMVAGMGINFAGISFGDLNVGATYYVKTVDTATAITLSETRGGPTKVLTNATGTLTATASATTDNATYWQTLGTGFNWRGEWQDDTEYNNGDVVRFGSNSYVCILNHRAEGDDGSTVTEGGGGSSNSRPDQDTSGTYWNVLTIGNEVSTLTTQGDLVYYGGAGPARLPIGTQGQVLTVSASGTPEWQYLWAADHEYYVSTNGIDQPYPIGGSTLQSAWATIRYAAEQILNGPRNPNARRLLEMNRAFIQRETVEWIDRQVATSTAPFTGSFDYDEAKCERDVGLVLDALVYDLSHGGNVRTRGAAQSFVGALTEHSEVPEYSRLIPESEESVAAYTYTLSLIQDVLNQEAPTVNYQVLNGDNSTSVVEQFFDSEIAAESGSYSTVASLMGVVTQVLSDQNGSSIPERISPNNLIKVAAGRYREVLPIIVPENTCIIGAELRSTNVGPRSASTSLDDGYYSVGAVEHLGNVIKNVIKGTSVTPTTGNTVSQDVAVPFADTVEEAQVDDLFGSMLANLDYRLNATYQSFTTDPVGYNSGFLGGYGDARTLLKFNREFIKAEIIAYIGENYPAVKYSKTICKRDVGYIVDAMVYDLTYGGYTQSLNAGLAYFDGPGSTLMIDSSESVATIASYQRLKTIMQQIVANTLVSVTAGNTANQFTDSTNFGGGSAASSFIGSNIDIIVNILTAGTTNGAPNVTVTSITGTDTLVTSGNHNLSVGDTFSPRSTSNGLTSGVTYWVVNVPTSASFKVSATYGGSAATLTNGTGLSIVGDIIDRPTATNGVTSTTALITAATTLDSQQENLVSAVTAFIAANYPSLTYNVSKCERDTRLILEAVMYDFMFNANFQTYKAAFSYLRSSASDVYDLGQKAATRAAYSHLAGLIAGDTATYLNSDSTAASRVASLMDLLDEVIFSGSNEGSTCITEIRNAHHAILQIERNRNFLVSEVNAWIADTYSDTVTNTAATTDLITISDTSWLVRNAAVKFTGTSFGGIAADYTYYVQNVVSATTFKISTTRNSNTALPLSTASGSMSVELDYNETLCTRDTNSYIDAIKYDLQYTGNYRTLLASRYYANSVVGSLEEDMYYLRDGTGIRDQTLEGLTGDLLAPNANGTSRVSAGAYCSLDPGYGPDDFHAWIINRSPYIQGVTTFGTAAVGQKIDGALHNGGNDSMVSNDFTQVISDGIGAWVTNNGRAELVSVFTYYSHIGYLAENGGRIRGTNGNNSYGDFGAAAEGFDSSETPDTAIVDNKFQFKALVGSVFTDLSDDVLQFEFDNAGVDYTEVEWLVSGSGLGAETEGDEFRDDAVFEVRLLDNVDDSATAPEADGNYGGFGYVTSTGTAQAGSSTSLTLSITDSQPNGAYIGMRLYITGGTGVGQFANISSYNAGTKVAGIVKPSTGAAGWDHIVPGTTIVSPDASSTYVVEPAISFTAPGFSAEEKTMSSSGTWTDVVYGDVCAVYTPLSGTYSGSGNGATWTVIRNGSKYSLSQVAAGTGYTRLETITLAGNTLGGTAVTNDLVITITAVNSTTGAIQAWDIEGYGFGGRFVAVKGTSTNAASYSNDGITWSATTLPSVGDWSAIAHGIFDDGSSVGKVSRFVAVRDSSNQAAYSADGLSWSASTLPSSTTWCSVAFGNGRFVAVNSTNSSVAVSLDGEIWDVVGVSSGAFNSVTYGGGKFVAVRAGTTVAAYSTDGVTWTNSTGGLPASSNWTSVTFGNNKFVAVADDSNNGAYSLNGTSWTAMAIGSPDSSDPAGYQKVSYGQGLYMATAYISGEAGEGYSYVMTSEDGLNWVDRGLPESASPGGGGYNAVAFGNPNRIGRWVAITKASGNHVVAIRAGVTAKARAFVAEEKIFAIRLTEPGSGYDSVPTMTITDPNNIYEAPTQVRTGKGALATPSFINRGTGFVSADAEVDRGDGYGDYFQFGRFIAVRRLSSRPAVGSNVVFGHLPDQTFKLVSVISFVGSYDGSYTAFMQISPEMKIIDAPANGTSITTRIRYSQVRLTGHDFLDIGTGSFIETNYPGAPTQGPYPANETVESNGGRVFFTSTDQDGNFRVGGLFNVEQSTGIATLNADAFNIAGLQELSLGEVTLGGASATITEFSTDPFFTADSDSVVPTQRAIKAYITSQIGGGGASLNVNSVTAGSIFISTNQISTIDASVININATVNFTQPVTGLPLAFNYFIL